MKRILIAISAIFTMLLYIASPLFIIPLKGHAEGVYVSKENLRSDIGDYAHYIYVCGIRNNNQYFSWVCVFNTYTENTAVITQDRIYIQGIKSVGSLGGNSSYKYANISSPTAYSSGGDEVNQCDWDTSSSTVRYTNNYSWSGVTIEYMESDLMPHELTDDVIVHFSPELTGHVTRPTITDNGVTRQSEVFTMELQNHSRNGIQYRFDIVEYDGQITDISMFEPNWATGFAIRGNHSYTFVNDEWIYVQPELTGGIIKTLKSSEWHYVGANETINQNFSWSQYPLESNKSYLARVIAVPNTVGCATALNSNRGGFGEDYPTFCIDYSEAVFVYNYVFDINNPASYNSNDTSFGNKISNSNYDQSKKFDVSAYENPSDGSLVISNADTSKDFRDILGAPTITGTHGGGGYYTGSQNNYNNNYNYSNNLNGLNAYFSNFFGFCNAALAAFPTAFLTIISAGLTGIVILGLVKVAIK